MSVSASEKSAVATEKSATEKSAATTETDTQLASELGILYQSWFDAMIFSERTNTFPKIQRIGENMFQQVEAVALWFEKDILQETAESLRKLTLVPPTQPPSQQAGKTPLDTTNYLNSTTQEAQKTQPLLTAENFEKWYALYDPMAKLPETQLPYRFAYAQRLVNELILLATTTFKNTLFELPPRHADLFGNILQVCQHFVKCDFNDILTRIHGNFFQVMTAIKVFKPSASPPQKEQDEKKSLIKKKEGHNNKQVILEFSPELERKFKQLGSYFYLETACLTLFRTNKPTTPPDMICKRLIELIELFGFCHLLRTKFTLQKNIRRLYVYQNRLLACCMQLMDVKNFCPFTDVKEAIIVTNNNTIINSKLLETVQSLVRLCESCAESLMSECADYPDILIITNLKSIKNALYLILLQVSTLTQRRVMLFRTAQRLERFFTQHAFQFLDAAPHIGCMLAFDIFVLMLDIFPAEMGNISLIHEMNIWFAYMTRKTKHDLAFDQTKEDQNKDVSSSEDDSTSEEDDDDDEEQDTQKKADAEKTIETWSLYSHVLRESFDQTLALSKTEMDQLASQKTDTHTQKKCNEIVWTAAMSGFLVPFVAHIFNNSQKFSNMVISNCVVLLHRGLLVLYNTTRDRVQLGLYFQQHQLYTSVVRCFGSLSKNSETAPLSSAMFTLLTDMKELELIPLRSSSIKK